MVMFETATLRSGFSVADSAGFAERIERMLRLSMDVSLDAKVNYFMFIYRKLLRSVCIAENLNRFLNSKFLIKVMLYSTGLRRSKFPAGLLVLASCLVISVQGKTRKIVKMLSQS